MVCSPCVCTLVQCTLCVCSIHIHNAFYTYFPLFWPSISLFTVNSISLNAMAAHRKRDIHTHISHQIVLCLIKLQIRAFDIEVHINTCTYKICTHDCAHSVPSYTCVWLRICLVCYSEYCVCSQDSKRFFPLLYTSVSLLCAFALAATIVRTRCSLQLESF